MLINNGDPVWKGFIWHTDFAVNLQVEQINSKLTHSLSKGGFRFQAIFHLKLWFFGGSAKSGSNLGRNKFEKRTNTVETLTNTPLCLCPSCHVVQQLPVAPCPHHRPRGVDLRQADVSLAAPLQPSSAPGPPLCLLCSMPVRHLG